MAQLKKILEEFLKSSFNGKRIFYLIANGKINSLTQEEIAKKVKCTTGTVKRFFEKLKKLKWIKYSQSRKKGCFASNFYSVNSIVKSWISQLKDEGWFTNIQNKREYKKYLKEKIKNAK